MAPDERPTDQQIALVLQGGGALGAYQAGVYEGLAEGGCRPDWIAGISIGGINAAIIAGNAPDQRVAKLREFWLSITASTPLWPDLEHPLWREFGRRLSALSALMIGQPGFFRPRWFGEFLLPVGMRWGEGLISFYDTADLRSTLERMVDFDRINAGDTRLSLGAVNVRTGNFAYFDSAEIKIRAEHVMASGALPPGFPPVEVDGEFFWDGGLVSNTPLQYILEWKPRRSTLAFQVDLFAAQGAEPSRLESVLEREKDIRYSSRTRAGTERFRYAHNLRRSISRLLAKLPDSLQSGPEVEHLRREACMTSMDIVELIYRPDEAQGHSKDYEFSRATMEARWAQGLQDARRTVAAAPWREPRPAEMGVRTFDVRPSDARGGAVADRTSERSRSESRGRNGDDRREPARASKGGA